MTILCHFGHIILDTSHQLGCVILNIHVTLDIFSHFGQCHKRSCFLLMHVDEGPSRAHEEATHEGLSIESKNGVRLGLSERARAKASEVEEASQTRLLLEALVFGESMAFD